MRSNVPSGQEGVASRRQLLAAGWSSREIQARVDAGRWQRVLPGVYATHTGPLPDLARVWAATLYGGSDAAAGGRTALWLWKVEAAPGRRTQLVVPWERKVVPQDGLTVVRRRGLATLVHPVASPARLRLEQAVLDVADTTARVEDAAALLLQVVQQRLTTAERLREAMSGRRLTRRALFADVLADVRIGVLSALERRYLRDVHRRHGLPPATFNAVEGPRGARRCRDVRYGRWRLVVELDGVEAHPQHLAYRDRLRDNALYGTGDITLRYGWPEVAGLPCTVARQVVGWLRERGWTGTGRACAPSCDVGRHVGGADRPA